MVFGGATSNGSVNETWSYDFAAYRFTLLDIATGYGAVLIRADSGSLLASSETQTPGSGGGTFGQAVPAIPSSDWIREGAVRSVLAVREDAGFRSNLILASGVDLPIDVEVALFDAYGTRLAKKRYSLPRLGMTQVNRVLRDLGVVDGGTPLRLALSTPTPGGAFVSYVTVVDNTTNDPRTLLPK